MSETTVDAVQKRSFTNATGYILSMLLSSQHKHHSTENWRSRFSVDRLLAITAKTPAKRGKISVHLLKDNNENPEIRTIKKTMVIGEFAQRHLSLLEKTPSIMALNAHATALVKSPCSRKWATQQDCPKKLPRMIVALRLNWNAATEKVIAKMPIP